jgi:NAD(P)-dependent dehydrogenase (short-subunit alcohol dehydrogenase family)
MQSIDGKIAWVTGAGTGIGRAGALALAGAGVTVYLSGRRVPELEAVKAKIVAAGGKAEVAPLDIVDADGCYTMVERIVKTHGRLDIVINSAGLNRPNRRWKDVDQESFHSIVDVDLKGAFNVCHAAIKVMRPQRDGLIINVSSMASQSRSGGVSGFPYADCRPPASKPTGERYPGQ